MPASATPENHESHQSWSPRPSCGRHYGSIYIPSLLKAYKEEGERAAETESSSSSISTGCTGIYFPKPDEEERRQQAYDDFTASIRGALSSTDTHGTDFRTAQDDDDNDDGWEMMVRGKCTKTAVVPLGNFDKWWKHTSSPPSTTPATTASAPLPLSPNHHNNHPSSTAIPVDNQDSQLRIPNFQLHFNSLAHLSQHVDTLVSIYLASYPGSSGRASNRRLCYQLTQLQAGKWPRTESGLYILLKELETRLRLMAIATDMLKIAGIPLPLSGQPCWEFDLDQWENMLSKFPNDIRSMKMYTAENFNYSNVLPDPTKNQPEIMWAKPRGYLAAGLSSDPQIDNPRKMGEAVKRLEKSKNLQISCVWRGGYC
jgi:hypothetical protein